jgi:hypothetical protein
MTNSGSPMRCPTSCSSRSCCAINRDGGSIVQIDAHGEQIRAERADDCAVHRRQGPHAYVRVVIRLAVSRDRLGVSGAISVLR